MEIAADLCAMAVRTSGAVFGATRWPSSCAWPGAIAVLPVAGTCGGKPAFPGGALGNFVTATEGVVGAHDALLCPTPCPAATAG